VNTYRKSNDSERFKNNDNVDIYLYVFNGRFTLIIRVKEQNNQHFYNKPEYKIHVLYFILLYTYTHCL